MPVRLELNFEPFHSTLNQLVLWSRDLTGIDTAHVVSFSEKTQGPTHIYLHRVGLDPISKDAMLEARVVLEPTPLEELYESAVNDGMSVTEFADVRGFAEGTEFAQPMFKASESALARFLRYALDRCDFVADEQYDNLRDAYQGRSRPLLPLEVQFADKALREFRSSVSPEFWGSTPSWFSGRTLAWVTRDFDVAERATVMQSIVEVVCVYVTHASPVEDAIFPTPEECELAMQVLRTPSFWRRGSRALLPPPFINAYTGAAPLIPSDVSLWADQVLSYYAPAWRAKFALLRAAWERAQTRLAYQHWQESF